MIDLHRFCGGAFEPRKWLRGPWREDRWVYYSDGCVVVREQHIATKHEGVPVMSVGGRGAGLFAKHFDQDVAFVLLPEVPAPDECPDCSGKGGIEHWGKCLMCCGRGELARSINRFGMWWDGVYLHRIGQLPAVRGRWIDNGNAAKPRAMELLFDGGQALLMPRTAE